MSEPFVGEIKMFAGNFAPRSFAFCDGQLLAVAQNNALFALLGTTYGGDGRTTFGLPDMRGRLPVHAGGSGGPGLTNRALGSKSGIENATVNANQLPLHTHTYSATTAAGTQSNPSGQVVANNANVKLFIEDPPGVSMAATALTAIGGSGSHTNLMPSLCVNFIIALFGIFPSRN